MTEPKLTAKEMIDRLRSSYVPKSDLPGGIFVPELGLNLSPRDAARARIEGR